MVTRIIESNPQLVIILVLSLLLIGIRIIQIWINYSKSNYGAISGIRLAQVLFNKGNYGEFRIFAMLENLSERGRLLTNLYVPKVNGPMTEIDLVMIDQTGIYVIESKNYGGWIFGDPNSKYWTQSLKGGNKNRFLNPIWQNRSHIKALQTVLPQIDGVHFYSYVVFSDRCDFKKVSSDLETVVTKTNRLKRILQKDIQERRSVFSEKESSQIFDHLRKFTLASEETKKKHIRNLNERMGNN